MISTKKEFVESKICQLQSAIDSRDKGLEYDAICMSVRVFGDEIPAIRACYDESIQYSGTTTRNAEIIIALLKEYLLNSQQTDSVFESTKQMLIPFQQAYKIYNDGLEKYEAGVFERNTLDDMRAAFESLVKALTGSTKTLENQISDLCTLLGNAGAMVQVKNMFQKIIDYYMRYQNDYVKHNDLVNSSEVEFVMELTSVLMKYLVKTLGGSSNGQA